MNAKKELQEILKGKAKIKCATITSNNSYYNDKKLVFDLMLNYTDDDLINFYNSLDFEYDSGYGGQELFGTVWLEDGTWLTRGEYDGSEWWDYNKLPEIPAYLLA